MLDELFNKYLAAIEANTEALNRHSDLLAGATTAPADVPGPTTASQSGAAETAPPATEGQSEKPYEEMTRGEKRAHTLKMKKLKEQQEAAAAQAGETDQPDMGAPPQQEPAAGPKKAPTAEQVNDALLSIAKTHPTDPKAGVALIMDMMTEEYQSRVLRDIDPSNYLPLLDKAKQVVAAAGNLPPSFN